MSLPQTPAACDSVKIGGIVLSPRNSAKSAALQAKFPELITVAGGNQEVVDGADVVVLALRPQVQIDVVVTRLVRKVTHCR